MWARATKPEMFATNQRMATETRFADTEMTKAVQLSRQFTRSLWLMEVTNGQVYRTGVL